MRLVGVAVTGFDDQDDDGQLSLFSESAETNDNSSRHKNLESASDMVKERFGEGMLKFGRELRLRGIDTGSSSKNPADYK